MSNNNDTTHRATLRRLKKAGENRGVYPETSIEESLVRDEHEELLIYDEYDELEYYKRRGWYVPSNDE